MVRIQAFLIAAFASLVLQAQGSLEARISTLEGVVGRYYRGEPLDEARARSNREIEAFNARTKSRYEEVEAARKRMEESLAPAREAYVLLQAADRAVAAIPPGSDQDEMKRKVEARNALAARVNALNAQGQPSADAYGALAKRVKEEVELERKRILGAQEALDARLAAFEAFGKGGQDVDFFISVNRLLMELRHSLRAEPGRPGLQEGLKRVRALRRELATWAMAAQARQPNGLVLVEARIGDEPCWLVVDTGATNTVIAPEIAEATGIGSAAGAEDSLTGVGGLWLKARAIRIPRLEAGGQSRESVAASAVRPWAVGIDGLLGQSFLKAFVMTLDERSPAKLILNRR